MADRRAPLQWTGYGSLGSAMDFNESVSSITNLISSVILITVFLTLILLPSLLDAKAIDTDAGSALLCLHPLRDTSDATTLMV